MISEGEQYEIELLTYPCFTNSRTDSLQEDLNHHFVNELQSRIYGRIKMDCYGCQVDHPSQVQHVLCLYTSSEEWVELYIEKALLQLDIYRILEKWYPRLHTSTDTEKGDARRLWIHLVEELTRHRSDLPCDWVSLWSERVIKIVALWKLIQYLLDHSPLLRPLRGRVCAKNELVSENGVRAYIVNTHKANQPGEYLVAIYFKGSTAVYIYRLRQVKAA
ncbi:hypothetical protein ACF0H5_009341 [Mactra antiquata]